MTWNFGDGFDFWNGASDMIAGTGPGIWLATGGGPSNAQTRFGSGQAATFCYNGIYTPPTVANNDQTHHVVFALRRFNSGTVGCILCFTFYDGTGVQCSVGVYADGTIKLYTGAGTGTTNGAGSNPGGTLLATSGSLLPLGAVWYGVEIEVKISSTAGQMKVRVNGNTVDDYASASNLNTRNGGTGNDYANKLTIFDQGGSYANGGGSVIAYMDDFLWFTTSGSAPNTWVGDIRATQQMPASDASVTMTPNSGTNNYSRVNQNIEDGDTTYVQSSTVGQIDYYGLTALATTPTTIIGVQTKMMSRKTDAGTRQARITTKSGSTVTTGATLTLGTSYTYTTKVDTVDPATSAAWTASAVNAFQVGQEVVA